MSGMDAFAPAEIAALVETRGVAKANAPFVTTFVLGVLAGAFIALGAVLATMIGTGSQLGFGVTRWLSGIGFSLGLILVVVAGAELFTGNNLIVMSVVSGKVPIARLLRNWTIVYIGNFVGALSIAVFVWLGDWGSQDEGAVGASAEEIDIRPSCLQMLKDIGHPFAKGRKVYDIAFENVQAGERTSHLFRLANRHGGFVVGTGDLSELALGWSTYGVGDHMSHYNVNASVPKTLVQYLIEWNAESAEFGDDVKRALRRVLETDISPELVPGAQKSEASVGPYELQDFHLYYTLRFGYSPTKVAYLAWNAWQDKYDLAEIRKWLAVFLKRFFQTSQYKRSAVPNAPKVGSGGSLSPRGDWRAPSDGNADAWLRELDGVP